MKKCEECMAREEIIAVKEEPRIDSKEIARQGERRRREVVDTLSNFKEYLTSIKIEDVNDVELLEEILRNFTHLIFNYANKVEAIDGSRG